MARLDLLPDLKLEVRSQREDGSTVHSTHDLNEMLGNHDGAFSSSGKRFGHHAQQVSLQNNILSAQLQHSGGNWVEDEIYIYVKQAQGNAGCTHDISFQSTGHSRREPLKPEHPVLNYDPTDDCRNLRLTCGSVLVAHCRQQVTTDYGLYVTRHIDLNPYLGNNNGYFDACGQNFSGSARSVSLAGTILRAELRAMNGSWQSDQICVSRLVRCAGGRLEPSRSVDLHSWGLLPDSASPDILFPDPSTCDGPLPPLYEPLQAGPNMIRVCYIAPGQWDDMIVCTLTTRPIEGSQPYKCLSYVWGDPSDTLQIRLNMHTIQVTRNLYKALRRLRWHCFTGPIWVDALCINQRDEGEKSIQVTQMATIYERSQEVLMWFGELAGNMFASILRDEPRRREQLRIRRARAPLDQTFGRFFRCLAADCHYWEAPGVSDLSAQGIRRGPGIESVFLSALLFTFQEIAWFQRTWTVQEYALQGNATIVIGSEVIEWKTLVTGADRMLVHVQTCCADALAADPSHRLIDGARQFVLHKFQMFQGIRGWSYMARSAESTHLRLDALLALLQLCRELEASDPRDKLFGFHGCAKAALGTFVPDYTTPAVEVFKRFTLYAIEQSSSLDIWELHVCCEDEDRRTLLKGLPSWAIDWTPTGKGDNVPLYAFLRKHNLHFKGACGDMKEGKVSRLEDGNTLTTSGSCFDIVARVTDDTWPVKDRSPGSTDHEPQMRAAFKQWTEFLGDDVHREAFWRAMVADHVPTNVQNPTFALPAGEPWRRLGPQDSDLWSTWFSERQRDPSRLCERHPILASIECMANSARLFTTATGDIGLGPSEIQPGDEIFLVHGSRSPVVFRQSSQIQGPTEHNVRHKLIGTCYVHSVMDGQMAHLLEDYSGTIYIC